MCFLFTNIIYVFFLYLHVLLIKRISKARKVQYIGAKVNELSYVSKNCIHFPAPVSFSSGMF